MQTNVLHNVIHALVAVIIGLAIFRFENVSSNSAPEELLASIFIGYLIVCLARRSMKVAMNLLR